MSDITELFTSLTVICDEISSKVIGDSSNLSTTSIKQSNNTNKTKGLSVNEEFIPEYGVGDKGPGGGIIFYVSRKGFKVFYGTEIQICHYLEMANDVIKAIPFYPDNYLSNIETKNGFGFGKENTWKICNLGTGELSTNNCAAYACAQYSTASTKKGDWFLPTYEEFFLLAETLKYHIDSSIISEQLLNALFNDCFWMSKIYDRNKAYYSSCYRGSLFMNLQTSRFNFGERMYTSLSFNPCYESYEKKSKKYSVVPIRAF